MEYIVSPWEAEAFVQSIQISDLEDVGTRKWFEYHKRLILLNQQCVLEISNLREESVKELFVSLKKIPVLIYEAIQIDIWKHNVFPVLIEINDEMKNTFMMFSVFYHENIVVSLLENVLFHSESAESMDDSVLDLVDYAVKSAMTLLDIKSCEIYECTKNPYSCLDDILEKKKELEFDIGIRCISILRYLAEFLTCLPICAISRMLTTHDVPYLLVQLIETKPWRKETSDGKLMTYDGTWKNINTADEGKICKTEGQVWLGLRELLLNPKCAAYYEITEHRISQLIKLQKYMHETLLDQLSPLVDLKRWLSYLNISSSSSTAPNPINIEVIPEIKLSILEKYHKKWKKVAHRQSKWLFTDDREYIENAARILSDAYDWDKLDCIETKKCFMCEEPAKKRCSKCKEAWYCGRECQVKHWDDHKALCDKISSSKDTE